MPLLRIAENGQALATIVVRKNAPTAEHHAAERLKHYLQQVTGAEFPVAGRNRHGPALYIGRSSEVDKLLGSFDWNRLETDGILLRVIDENVILAGQTPRGTLYAVYEFLERVLDCRWLAPGVTHLPKRAVVDVPPLQMVYAPALLCREPHSHILTETEWAVANRANGALQDLDETHGGRWVYARHFVHNFFALVPPAVHFDKHPEYFSEINGVRCHAGGQLCLTNPDVLDLATDACRKILQAHPEAAVMTLSQMDWNGWCTCPVCSTVDEAEGSPSGTLLTFVNAVAERLEKEFPSIWFDTLAYTYSVRPPRTIRPRANVIIRLCNMGGCDSHPLERCEHNRPFVEILRQWSLIAPTIFIWDYHNNFSFYFQPYPNLDRITIDIAFLAANRVRGYFAQLDASPTKGPGDMVELRGYLISRLLWDPTRDGWGIVDEFCRLYYGPAAEPIRYYLDHLQDYPRKNTDWHATLYQPLMQPAFTPEWMERARALFDEAERLVADQPEFLDRVRTARLPVDYLTWKPNLIYRITDRTIEPADPAVRDQATRFLAQAYTHGARGLRESGPSIEQAQRLLAPHPLETLQAGGITVRIAPALGGRLVSLRDATGQEWLRAPQPLDGDTPLAGGYEEYSERAWRSPGWSESYQSRRDGQTVTLSAMLGNGLRLDRAYRLETSPGGAILHIESTLTNPGEQPRDCMLRVHPVFDPATWDAVSIQMRNPDGTRRSLAPWEQTEMLAGSTWFERDETPAGEWALIRGTSRLVMQFDRPQVAKTLLDWNRRDASLSLELFGIQTRLPPGQSLHINQQWTFNQGTLS